MRSLRVSFPFSMVCIVLLFLIMQLSFKAPSVDVASATTAGGNETDHLALLKFKAKIVHDPQNATSSWNDSAHFCNWEGVTCGRKHKRVTILDLNSKGLVGTLSPYVGNMSFLREINLYNNSLQGEIPSELGRLFRLQVLYLNNNSFEGKIPSNLSECSNIMLLGLAYNKLVGNIPVELVTLSKLRKILIHFNYLSNGIPPFLGNFSLLEVLSAGGNFFGGSIPDSLGQLKYLSAIALGSNNLSGIIPPAIYNISSITLLSVANNSLHGSLPPNIGLLLPHLQKLQMWGNHFTGSIPVSLSNASELLYIALLDNNFTGKLDVDFGGLQRLGELNLHGNHLGSRGDNSLDFIISLLNCSNLKLVEIASNQFQGVLPNFVANNISTPIEWLAMEYNQIGGRLPPWLSMLVSLSHLDIGFNQITGTIPMEIGSLSRLQRLYLDSNRLTGPIPPSIGNLSLMELYLSKNHLRGAIPSSLDNSHTLLFLMLSHNNLNGTIPKQLFATQSMLVSLALDQNHLVGSLPLEIGNSFNLNELDISQNLLSGKIPIDIGRCNSLLTLYMHHNNFEGTIPLSFASLRSLEKIDLSHNNFSGEIPKYLEKFRLEYINLSFNNFEGEVPIKGVFANFSAISIVGNNRLCGGISELQLPRCPAEGSKRRKFHLVNLVVIIMSCIFGISMLSTAMYCWFKKKKRGHSPASLQMKSFQKISYQMILKATDGFSATKLIGVGSFGSVYQGSFAEDGVTFAVKVLNLQQRGASKSFMAECKALRIVRHRNLVKIITSCSSIDFQGNDFKALVYEYMPNGNLNKWLHPDHLEIDEQPSLSLLQRLNIAIDVGNALDYLHHHCPKPIIHCDLKPSNILLDNDMVAHVGDFGLAKFLPQLINPTQSSSIGVRGTIGYTAPEYGLGSEVSTSGDVYSYGILLLEMVTGKKPTDDIFVEGLNLHNFAKMALPNQMLETIDSILLQEDGGVINRASKSFMAECETLKNVRHRNLLKIITSCSSIDFQGNEFKALIYEYMPNGNLEKWLHLTSKIGVMPIDDHYSLSLFQRIDIAIDVANALDYLHHHCHKPIVHCDLKPSNILLDEDMVARVGDFGLAKFLHQPPEGSSLGVRGTIGYTAPEYGLGSEVSTSGDVYSFGILLLEMMTRKKPTNDNFGEGHNLHNFCKMAFPDQVLEIVDPILLQEDEARANNEQGSAQSARIDNRSECLISMIKTGIACSMEAPQDRMGISDALNNLHSIRKNYIRTTTY
ncbi:putative receptor-like protein kinase At3g47110 isoform X2 [Hevea brasiliensis]|uniref:putative receptor-like protein kinase At3g47110 isoform X2 n=1 Tax=Hevea brasiliensis TaxID=3981 RepID=UPI0025F5CE35|nr:putative receptor-like protein kinase At3g47110 isoform X2 [Hevea brasiliensis]